MSKDELVVEYGWTYSICQECSSIQIHGHVVAQSSGTLFVPHCIALDKHSYTCNGQMVERPTESVGDLFHALYEGVNQVT